MRNMPLDFLGLTFGTDKSLIGMDYLRHYDRALSAIRERTFNLIEIGVHDGASVQMWRSFFPNAHIVGIDIQERCKAFAGDRISIEIGSQADNAFLDEVVKKYPPLVIIDDGSHQADHIIGTFDFLFRKLLAGGCYIVEDLIFHGGDHGRANRGRSNIGAQTYLLSYIRQLMDQQVSELISEDEQQGLYAEIDHIEAVRGAAMIWKASGTGVEPDYALLSVVAERSGMAKTWSLLAGFIIRTGGPLDLAQTAAQNAAELAPNDWTNLEVLALIEDRRGNPPAAIAHLTKAREMADPIWYPKLDAHIQKMTETATS